MVAGATIAQVLGAASGSTSLIGLVGSQPTTIAFSIPLVGLPQTISFSYGSAVVLISLTIGKLTPGLMATVTGGVSFNGGGSSSNLILRPKQTYSNPFVKGELTLSGAAGTKFVAIVIGQALLVTVP